MLIKKGVHMKRAIVAMLLAFSLAFGARAVDTNAWAAAICATQTVASVRLDNISITLQPTGKVGVRVAWSWLSDTGKVLRNGVSAYSQEEIDARLVSKGASVAFFRELFLAIAAAEAVEP